MVDALADKVAKEPQDATRENGMQCAVSVVLLERGNHIFNGSPGTIYDISSYTTSNPDWRMSNVLSMAGEV